MNLLSPSLRLHKKIFRFPIFVHIYEKINTQKEAVVHRLMLQIIPFIYSITLCYTSVRLTKIAPHVTQIFHILALSSFLRTVSWQITQVLK